MYHNNYEPRGGKATRADALWTDDPAAIPEATMPSADRTRTKALRWYRFHGYTVYNAFKNAERVKDDVLIASGLCRRHDPAVDKHKVPLVPIGNGPNYFQLVERWDLLLVRPGMALQLLELLDPTRARYWTSCIV